MKTAMYAFCSPFPSLSWVLRWDKISDRHLCRHGNGAEQTDCSANIVYKQPDKGTFCSPALWNVKYNPKHKTMKVVFKAQQKRMVRWPKIERGQSRRSRWQPWYSKLEYGCRFFVLNLCSKNSDFQFGLSVRCSSSGSNYQASISSVINVSMYKSFPFFIVKTLLRALMEVEWHENKTLWLSHLPVCL